MPQRAPDNRRRATGIVRTLVVASATLAILLVCYAIYQYSQRDAERLSAMRKGDRATAPSPLPLEPLPAGTGVKVGDATISTVRRIKLSLYASEGDRARMQIEVAESIPTGDDQLRLVQPEIRLRTTRGNAVRVTADEGLLHASRRSGSSLDPQRGNLKGNVLIEIDRRSDEDLAALSVEDRARPDPTAIIRVEMDEIEFDAEYAKVIIPGPFRLSASDVDLRAADLEVRFDEVANRVDLLRIGKGERLELRQLPQDAMGGAMPTMGTVSEKKLTLVELLRSTIEARLVAQAEGRAANGPPAGKPEGRERQTPADPSAVPAFVPAGEKAPKAPRPPVKYFARFEQEVDAAKEAGGVIVSRMQADAIEVLRDFGEEDGALSRPAERRTDGAGATASTAPAAVSDEKIVLLWSGPLVVEAVDPADARVAGGDRALVTAVGSPVRVSHHEPAADATCARLVYSPDDGAMRLYADETHPVVVRSPEHGVMTGTQLFSEQDEQRMHVVVSGPGSLVQSEEHPTAGDAEKAAAPTKVEFVDSLELFGRTVTRTRLDFTGTLSSRQSRVMDKAVFKGGVLMSQDQTRVAADELSLFMQPPRGGRDESPSIERVEGRGKVSMVQGTDRISCDEIDLALETDADGRITPVAATARGNVDAVQDRRSIRARDRLFVEFQSFQRPPPPFDAVNEYNAAIARGEDPAAIDWDQRRMEHQAAGNREVAVKHMQATGAVSITDPAQALEVAAEELDCSLADGRNIEEAVVTGPADGPASVKLRTFAVSGRQIKLNVRDEWAEVPGAGRLSFRSGKDLNGQKLDSSIPITIEWQEQMRYQGRENRARFVGAVHAVSRNDTTFDSDDLYVEFEDAAPAKGANANMEWWIFEDLAARLDRDGGGDAVTGGAFAKEPAFLEARGSAIVATQSRDAAGALLTRAVLKGPKLSVNLRKGVSHMQMEAPGTLLLEDYRTTRDTGGSAGDDLLGFDQQEGPSQTLVEWKDSMFYDFASDQTRFEGEVKLRHLGGRFAQLGGGAVPAAATGGRKTFLDCNRLHVDFQSMAGKPSGGDSRMGRIAATRLMQFQASENVDLRIQNDVEDLALTCDDLKYEKNRQLLSIQGTPRKLAEIVVRKATGEITTQTLLRGFFDIKTKRIEGAEKPTFRN